MEDDPAMIRKNIPAKMDRLIDSARSLGSWCLLCLDTTILGTSVIAMSFWDRDGFLSDHVGRFWSRFNLRVLGIDVEVEGLENLDPGSSYVMMVNHSSLLDIWIIYDVLPRQIRWVMKSELRKIPVFGYACGKMGHIYVERGNTSSARASMKEAARKVAEGASVVFFPEGTRSDGMNLLPFKKGGFRLAIEAGVPIAPVVIKGTADLMPSGDWVYRKGTVRARVLKPIEHEGSTSRDLQVLIDKTRKAMESSLREQWD